MALAVGNANSGVEFVFPTSQEMGHPIKGTRRISLDYMSRFCY